mmetsp:Transcript_10161/g.31086  ORF Transcript_10161/g.31086 Transcript_10161/m.31086 type:complete len:93 (-) Transcript_10161:424-702(-)
MGHRHRYETKQLQQQQLSPTDKISEEVSIFPMALRRRFLHHPVHLRARDAADVRCVGLHLSYFLQVQRRRNRGYIEFGESAGAHRASPIRPV